MRLLNLTGWLLLFFLGLVGCNKEKDLNTSKEEYCLYLNSENIGKTIPIINDYLATLKRNLNEEQKLLLLVKWLKAMPCVIDADILCVECIYTLPAISEIWFSFEENGIIKKVVLDAQTVDNVMRVWICSISEQNDNNVQPNGSSLLAVCRNRRGVSLDRLWVFSTFGTRPIGSYSLVITKLRNDITK